MIIIIIDNLYIFTLDLTDGYCCYGSHRWILLLWISPMDIVVMDLTDGYCCYGSHRWILLVSIDWVILNIICRCDVRHTSIMILLIKIITSVLKISTKIIIGITVCQIRPFITPVILYLCYHELIYIMLKYVRPMAKFKYFNKLPQICPLWT